MIQPNELRIGNLVSFDGEELPVYSIAFERTHRIKRLNNQWVIGLYVDDNYSKIQMLSELTPIPLTEEWLLKFGFEFGSIDFKLENNDCVIKLMFHDCWHFYFKEKGNFSGDQINLTGYWSVHQLQNLFFSLCGEELTVK